MQKRRWWWNDSENYPLRKVNFLERKRVKRSLERRPRGGKIPFVVSGGEKRTNGRGKGGFPLDNESANVPGKEKVGWISDKTCFSRASRNPCKACNTFAGETRVGALSVCTRLRVYRCILAWCGSRLENERTRREAAREREKVVLGPNGQLVAFRLGTAR